MFDDYPWLAATCNMCNASDARRAKLNPKVLPRFTVKSDPPAFSAIPQIFTSSPIIHVGGESSSPRSTGLGALCNRTAFPSFSPIGPSVLSFPGGGPDSSSPLCRCYNGHRCRVGAVGAQQSGWWCLAEKGKRPLADDAVQRTDEGGKRRVFFFFFFF